MKSIFSYFIIILTSWTIFVPLRASLDTQPPAPNARERLRRASDSVALLAERRPSLDLENYVFPRKNTPPSNLLAHPDNSDRTAARDEVIPQSESMREKLMKTRKSVVRFLDSATLSPKSSSQRSNSTPSPLIATDRIQEMQPQPSQSIKDAQKARTKFCLEALGVSTLAGLYFYAKRNEESSMPTRFATGAEPIIAGAIFKGVLAYGSTALALALTGYSLWKINRWIHRSCRSDLAKVEEKFEKRLACHVGEVNIGFEQINEDVATLASDVGVIAGVLEEILPAEQAREMQAVGQNANSIQANLPKRFKVPKKSGWCC